MLALAVCLSVLVLVSIEPTDFFFTSFGMLATIVRIMFGVKGCRPDGLWSHSQQHPKRG
jgi:hypothetical protein